MSTSSRTAESVWLRNLRDGAGFSCLLGSGAGQAIEGFWREVFSTTRPGSRILEIGCGAGDVSVWAAEAGRQFEVIASDIHDQPDLIELPAGVTFLANARAEALPLTSASIDMVVSNFAFEYTPFPQSPVQEMVRVLRPGGAVALVIHSNDSSITTINRQHLEMYKKLGEADVPARIRRAAGLRADHLSRRKLLKDVLKMRGVLAGGEPYFEIADRLLSNDPKARQDYEILEKNVERATEIAECQVLAAVDKTALTGLEQQFAALDMSVFTTEITGTQDLMDRQKFGWLMFLNKPAPSPVGAAAS